MRAVEIVIEMEGGLVHQVLAFHRQHPSNEPDQILPRIYVLDRTFAEEHPEEERDSALRPLEFAQNVFPHRTAEEYINEVMDKHDEDMHGKD